MHLLNHISKSGSGFCFIWKIYSGLLVCGRGCIFRLLYFISMLFPNELNCWQICSPKRFHNAQKTPGVIFCFFIKAIYDSCNQICRSALGNSPDIKNGHKWISSAPRNPCQPHTQPQALAWIDCSIWHCQGDLPENSQHFLSEDAGYEWVQGTTTCILLLAEVKHVCIHSTEEQIMT